MPKFDRRWFRIAVKFAVPPDGLRRLMDEFHALLSERLGSEQRRELGDLWSELAGNAPP